jgi:hypothetical protein
MTQDRGERGSTLLEVLIAFVILTGAMILSFRIFGDGLRGMQSVEERSRMMSVVRSELARLELSAALQPGQFRGRNEDGYFWAIEIAAEGEEPRDPSAVVPFRVRLMVGKDPRSGIYVLSAETILLAAHKR